MIGTKTRWTGLAALAATIGLLGLVPPAEGQGQLQVNPNYRLNSDPAPFRGQDQIGFAVNPNNPQHVVAVYANYLDSTCEASASFDGGSTWSPEFALTPPTAGGAFAKSCSNTVGATQYVEFGSGNTVYTGVAAQRQDVGFLQDASALLYKSTDGGVTWQTGVVAMQGGAGGVDPNVTPGPIFYRPTVSVDRGAGTGGADRIYLVARDIRGTACPTGTCLPIKSAVSNDGGQSFSAPVNVTPATTNAQDFPSKPVVNPDHSVTVAWRTTGAQALIQVARSTDGGQTWSSPPIDVTRVTNTGTPVTSHVTPGPSPQASYPRMAGNPTNGRLYMVYSQGSTGPTEPDGGYKGSDHFISPDSQAWFQRSTDGGLTWSTPKRISEQTTYPGSRTHQTRHPTISVSPNGRINIVWHDRRHWYQGPGERNCTHSHIFCEDIRLGDTYYSYSTDGGDSFSQPRRITDRSRNNEVGYDTRPSGYWWFGPQSVTVGGDDVLIGWMDSRNGNWDTDTDDIYLAKVNFDAVGGPAKTHVDQADAISRSVALSRLGYPGGNEGALIGGARDPAGAGPNGPATRNASAVVIVNETDVAGALAGTVLARANPGPVLLSPAAGLPTTPTDVQAEVRRMRPGAAFVIGDTTRLSNQVITDLEAAAVPVGQVTRISGGNDAAIAAQIAQRMDYRTPAEKAANSPAFDAVVIANPASPDAAAAAGMAAARRLPYLFVNSNSIPAETAAALSSLNIDKTLVIGGPTAVNDSVLPSLPNPTRLGGADQYETSKAVVDESQQRGLPRNVVYVADGSRPMDAALLGDVVGRATGLLVLAPPPLFLTGEGQAASFAGGGIDRLFLIGPAATGPPAGRTPSYPRPVGGSGSGSLAGCPAGRRLLSLTAANDTRNGTAGNDLILAGAGNDTIDALAGDDCVDLGLGRDRGQGGAGNDLVLGGDGVDRILGNDGNDRLRGGAAVDTILGGLGNDAIHGQSGNDRVTGSRGRDRINGGRGRDRLGGGSSADRISGDAGNDRISGNSGNDRIKGNSGNDRITGGAGRDRISCGRGTDTVIADRRDVVARDCERVRRRR